MPPTDYLVQPPAQPLIAEWQRRFTEHHSVLPSLSHVTSSAVSEHLLVWLGFPIAMSRTASYVCLELRPLSSTSITRLLKYYGPVRHPKAPSLSLTGRRLVFPHHAKGLPVLRALPLCTCSRYYPGTATGC